MASTGIVPRKRGIDPSRLSDQQLIFVEELAAEGSFNSTAAARKAGYKNPGTQAGKLLKQPKIKAYLGKILNDRLERLGLNQDRLLKELEYLALRDIIDLCDENGRIITDDLSKLPEKIRRCIDSIKQRSWCDQEGNEHTEVEIKLAPKLASLELAMKHFGMLTEKKDITVKQEVDWDELCEDNSEITEDPVEQRILDVGK